MPGDLCTFLGFISLSPLSDVTDVTFVVSGLCLGTRTGSGGKAWLKANEMNVGLLRKIVSKTKIERIKSKQIIESCGIQPINEWVERIREWEQHVTRMDAERLIRISRDNIPVGSRSPGCPKRRWSNLIID